MSCQEGATRGFQQNSMVLEVDRSSQVQTLKVNRLDECQKNANEAVRSSRICQLRMRMIPPAPFQSV